MTLYKFVRSEDHPIPIVPTPFSESSMFQNFLVSLARGLRALSSFYSLNVGLHERQDKENTKQMTNMWS